MYLRNLNTLPIHKAEHPNRMHMLKEQFPAADRVSLDSHSAALRTAQFYVPPFCQAFRSMRERTAIVKGDEGL
jgi:hypothetical protein